MQKFGTKEAEHGGLKVYTTIDPRLSRRPLTAVIDHEGGANLDAQPAAALATVDPSNGNVLAIASSATYEQTKFDYPGAGRAADRISVQGVRADDADPRL